MTSTDVRTEAEDSGPSGYAAARLRLLQEEARSGPPRRAALAELTDDWLVRAVRRGRRQAARHLARRRRRLRPRRALPAQRSRPAAPARRQRRPGRGGLPRRPHLVPDLGPRPRPRPLRPHARRGTQDRGRGPQGPARAAGRPAPRRRPRPHRRTAHGRPRRLAQPGAETSPRTPGTVRRARRAPGRVAVPPRTRPQGGPRRPARRHRAARRRRLLARRRPARGPLRRPQAPPRRP